MYVGNCRCITFINYPLLKFSAEIILKVVLLLLRFTVFLVSKKFIRKYKAILVFFSVSKYEFFLNRKNVLRILTKRFIEYINKCYFNNNNVISVSFSNEASFQSYWNHQILDNCFLLCAILLEPSVSLFYSLV